MPNMGGSLPLYLFADILQAPIVSVPVVNHDNNQHAANENLRIQNLWDAIETYAVLVARLDARMDCCRAPLTRVWPATGRSIRACVSRAVATPTSGTSPRPCSWDRRRWRYG